MSNINITIDQFKDLLKRVEKLEQREAAVDIDELNEKYHNIEKEVAVTDTKIDALRVEMNEKFNTMNEKFDGKFDSLEKRLDMMWKVQLLTLGVILTSIIGVLIKVFL